MYMHVIKSFLIKLKTQKYHTVTTTAKSNTEIVGRDKIDILNTQVHDCSLSWPSTGTSIKRGGLNWYYLLSQIIPFFFLLKFTSIYVYYVFFI